MSRILPYDFKVFEKRQAVKVALRVWDFFSNGIAIFKMSATFLNHGRTDHFVALFLYLCSKSKGNFVQSVGKKFI